MARGRPPGSNKPPKLYDYRIVFANAPNSFEVQVNRLAQDGWKVIGQSFSSVQFFSCIMEKLHATETAQS